MDSSQKRDRRKTTGIQSAKPFPDFPLFAHKSGRWCKKITVNGRSRFVYFGRLADGWEPALKLFEAQKVDLYAGRTPDTMADGVSLLELCHRFLEAKESRAERGKMTWRSFHEYRNSLAILMDAIGRTVSVENLKPADFDTYERELSKRFGAVAEKNHILRVRSLLKFGVSEGILERPVTLGDRLALPAKRDVLLERAAKGEKLFSSKELRRLLAYKVGDRLADPVALRAMLYLAINCALGNDDVGRLTFSALDLDGGWCNLVRHKTGIRRRAKLWPETVQACRAAIAKRPTPKDPLHQDRVFITKYGGAWSKEQTAELRSTDNPVAQQFAKLVKGAGVAGNGRGFYCLRHTFFTVAGNGGDQVAASSVMGHSDASIAANYRHRINDKRLVAVSSVVRDWLFPLVLEGDFSDADEF